MPDSTLQQAIVEAYASAPASQIILHTLEFRHPAFIQPIRVVRDVVDFIATLEPEAPQDAGQLVRFIGYAFDLRLPQVGGQQLPEVEVEIDNVSRDISAALDAAANSGQLIEMTYRPYLQADPSAPQMDPPLTLIIRECRADVFRVRCRASFGNLASLQFPNQRYTSALFPGLTGG